MFRFREIKTHERNLNSNKSYQGGSFDPDKLIDFNPDKRIEPTGFNPDKLIDFNPDKRI